jgi:hypothetical protein
VAHLAASVAEVETLTRRSRFGVQLGDERIETLHLSVRITQCHTHVLTFSIPQNQETLAKGREERLRRLAATP